jgi:glycosyltransferase involved in cell wall biosynthesis
VFPGFCRRPIEHNNGDNGIKVIRCFSIVSSTSTVLSRLAENLSFGFISGFVMMRISRPDVIYINTWPLFAAGIASCVARFRRVPIVLSIQDVYPESLIALRKFRFGTQFKQLLRLLDARIARAASAVVVISKRAEDIYLRDRKIARMRVHRIANWRAFEDQPAQDMVQLQRQQWGIGVDVF